MLDDTPRPDVPGTPVDFDPFARGELERCHPAIDAQREIWMAMYLAPEAAAAYNDTVSLTLDGPLDRGALDEALNALVRRHEALRASFTEDGAMVCVWRSAPPRVVDLDLSRLSPSDQRTGLGHLEDDHVLTPPDFAKAPALRVSLARLHARRHVLVLTVSHILCDGLSWGVLLKDLSALYAAARGTGPQPDPPSSFLDYMAVATREEREEALAPHLDYWRQVLEDGGPAWTLPLDRPAPVVRGFACGRVDRLVPAALIDRLKVTARAHGLTFHALMLSAFVLFLHRVSGADDIITGVPAAGQVAHGFPDMIGHAVHLLPLRTRYDADTPFVEAARGVRGALLEAMEHQAVDYGTLMRALHIPREPGRVPLMPVIFNIDQGDDLYPWDGLTTTPRAVPRRMDAFEVFLDSVDRADGLELQWYHAQWLFDEATIASHADGFLALLEAIAEAPETAAGDLPLMSESARHRWCEDWTGGTLDLPDDAGVPALVAAQAAATPDAIAVTDDHGATLTYAALWAQAGRVAGALRAAGLEPGQVVGVLVDRDVRLVPTVLGLWRAGAVYLPLDPEFPAARLATIVADAGLAGLVTDPRVPPAFDPGDAVRLDLDAMLPADAAVVPDADADGDGGGDLPPLPGGDTLAYLIYTSGSTGQPKGVQISHWGLANFLSGMQQALRLTPDSRVMLQATISFDISFVEMMQPLIAGARTVVAGRETVRDPMALADLVRAAGVTHWQATVQFWRMLLAMGWSGDPALVCLSAAEPLAPDVAEGLLGRCGALWNLYGPTEITVYATAARITDPGDITVGTPLPNYRVYVLDGRGHPQPPGLAGEIVIGERGVTRGYLNRPALNAEVLRPDPVAGTGTVYHSGDLGLLTPDGRLRHLGRRDAQLKVRGFRIEPEDIEAHLIRQPGVAEAAVVVQAVAAGDARLVAAITPRDGAVVDAAALRAALTESLPGYMVPGAFVPWGRLPRTGSGKLNRRAVREALEQGQGQAAPAQEGPVGPRVVSAPAPAPAPVPSSASGRAAVVPESAPAAGRADADRMAAGQSDVLARLVDLWRDLLQRPDLGPDTPFFDAGGHSLLAAQLMVRVNRQFNAAITLGEILRYDTPAALARLVLERYPVPTQHGVNLQPGAPGVPPLFLMPPQGGQILRYGPLMAHLDERLPVWAFEQGAALTRLTTVEDIARVFAADIQRLCPDGPLRIGGFSFGGLLAVEAAQRLREAGREVEWLVLLDALNWPRESVWFKLHRAILEGRFASDKLAWLRAKVHRNALKLVGRYRDPEEDKLDILDDPTYALLMRVHLPALIAYDPPPYEGRVLMIRAVGDPIQSRLLPDGGWAETFQGQVVTIDVDIAEHLEVLQGGGAALIGAVINRHLVEGRGDGP